MCCSFPWGASHSHAPFTWLTHSHSSGFWSALFQTFSHLPPPIPRVMYPLFRVSLVPLSQWFPPGLLSPSVDSGLPEDRKGRQHNGPKYACILNSGSCDPVTLHGKQE